MRLLPNLLNKSAQYLLLVLSLGATLPAQAQSAATYCGGGRYTADVFTDITVSTAIEYGRNVVVNSKPMSPTPVTLLLDFYEPTGDAALRRPLLVFAFGGAFVNGQRSVMDDLCRAFARKGYATATIDYRLVPANNQLAVFSSAALLADEIVRASSDMKAAVRFFRRYADTYRIDPEAIIVAGYSAGAITALQTAYIDSPTEDPTFTAAYANNGGLEGDTDLPAPNQLLPAYNARGLAGTLNLAGGVATLAVVSAGNPPLYSAHGTADTVVPYAYGPVFSPFSPYSLYGSGPMQVQATSVGISNQLYPIAGGDHGSTRTPANSAAISAAAATFFQGIICPAAPLPVVLTDFAGRVSPAECTATLTWRTATEVGSRAYEVQASADGRQFALVGTVPSHNQPAGARYSFQTAPLAGTQYFRLRLLDADGTATYSPVLRLAAACPARPLLLAPNPARDQVQVSGLPAGTTQLTLYNTMGQCVLRNNAAGDTTLAIGGLPIGIYLLTVTDATGAALGRARLVKE